MAADPSVSPADTPEPLWDATFRARMLRQGLSNDEIAEAVELAESVARERDALLAVGERDKAEIEQLQACLGVLLVFTRPEDIQAAEHHIATAGFVDRDFNPLPDARERDRRQIERLNAEANDLTSRAETAEAAAERLKLALRRIADEPPNRGMTPNFREFARAVLDDEEDAPDNESRITESMTRAAGEGDT